MAQHVVHYHYCNRYRKYHDSQRQATETMYADSKPHTVKLIMYIHVRSNATCSCTTQPIIAMYTSLKTQTQSGRVSRYQTNRLGPTMQISYAHYADSVSVVLWTNLNLLEHCTVFVADCMIAVLVQSPLVPHMKATKRLTIINVELWQTTSCNHCDNHGLYNNVCTLDIMDDDNQRLCLQSEIIETSCRSGSNFIQ